MGEHVESEPKLLGNAGVSRRQILARSAVAAGVVWAAPVVRTASAYALTSAGTSRPCTQFYVAGLSLSGNWYPKYPYGFVPSLEQTSSNVGTTPSQGGATAGVQTSRDGATSRRTSTAPKKLSKREYAQYFDGTDTDGTGHTTVPKLIDEWLRQNPSVPLLEPDVYPQITQTGAQGWAVLLPEVTGPNAAARQPRFIIGYAWQGSHYAYGYVDPRPANPALAGRRILFPSPVGREPGVGDEAPTPASRRRGRRSTTTSSSTTSTSSSTTSSTVAPTTTTVAPGAPAYGPAPAPTTTSTSSTTTSTSTTTTTLPPTTTTTLPAATTTTSTTTTTTLPPTTTTTRPGWGKGGSKTTTTTTPPPTTTTTTVPPTTTTSTTTTTIPSGSTTTTTTTTSPGGTTTTTTTDPFSQWWIAAHSDNGSGGWGGTVPSGPGNGGGNGSGRGATSGGGKKIGFLDTGAGPAGPAGPGALSPTDSRQFADYFATTDGSEIGPAQGAPIKGVILIYCKP